MKYLNYLRDLIFGVIVVWGYLFAILFQVAAIVFAVAVFFAPFIFIVWLIKYMLA